MDDLQKYNELKDFDISEKIQGSGHEFPLFENHTLP